MVELYFVLLSAIVTAVGSIWRGFVLTFLWGWYIVPVFHVPTLTIMPAIGISLLTGYLTHQASGMQDDDKVGNVITAIFIHPAAVLFIGWIIHFFL